MHPLGRRCRAGIALAFFLVGCTPGAEGDAGREKVYKVKGKVTMNGGPVANAMVSFSPKAKQPVATARTGADGQFSMTTYSSGDGAAAGDYIVLVIKEIAAAGGGGGPPNGHEQGQKDTPDLSNAHAAEGGAGTAVSAGLPLKYSRQDQSDLQVTVKPDDSNDFPLDLKP